MNSVKKQALSAMLELLESASALREEDILVIGCSTSEVMGRCIGTGSNSDAAAAIMDAVYPHIRERGLFLAVQCCEHLNRALVVERACMNKYGLEQVWVRPHPHAGGAFAALALNRLHDPVIVEDLQGKACAGMDIGGTFIGMHMRPVVVPIHAKTRRIGDADVVMARTRPKYIGGPRAQYEELLSH